MNSSSGNAIANPRAQTFLSAFGWLVKREYWEYRTGLLRAPIIIVGVLLGIVLLALITAEVTAFRHGININGMNMQQITQHLNAVDTAKFSEGVQIGLFTMGFPIAIWSAIAVFFYLLGALYNDRNDRSVLFWKSLPISDRDTVLAKALFAGLFIPLVAVVAVIALQLGFLILLSSYAIFHGVNPLPLLWSPGRMLSMWLKLLMVVPINALWAMPTIGWLLLCSSFARSKPFLWAVMLPVLVGVMLSWVDLLQSLSLPKMWFWKNVVGRLLLSAIPGSWLSISENIPNYFHNGGADFGLNGGDDVSGLLSLSYVANLLAVPDFWIGLAAGVAMIIAAIYFRRKRTEAYS